MHMRSALIRSVLLAATAAAAATPAPPTEFKYEPLQDDACVSARQQQIKPEWSSELRDRLPELRAIWESESPAMVTAVYALTRKSFSPPPTVHLTLCDLPSNSFLGVTVNIRYALSSFTATPVPMRYKVDTAFHETLHGFIAHHTPRTSSLLVEHASESVCVRNHLHLLALQKAVLLSVNDYKALEQVIAIDSQLPSGCYKRAWTLVNSSPSTYLHYVAELSQ
jgi:hypothetical protein